MVVGKVCRESLYKVEYCLLCGVLYRVGSTGLTRYNIIHDLLISSYRHGKFLELLNITCHQYAYTIDAIYSGIQVPSKSTSPVDEEQEPALARGMQPA